MASEALELGRKRLAEEGYVVTSDHELGFPAAGREHIRRSFFHNGILKRYEIDLPVDRERARDVVRYEWADGDLKLSEHDTTTITDRGGYTGAREYGRVEVLHDANFEKLVRIMLSLVPVERRTPRGTFGINLFRTFTNVVTRAHRDGEPLVFIYVLGKTGSGAETWLSTVEDPAPDQYTHKSALQPGDLLVFDDNKFFHSVTPLVDPPDGRAQRDALVCTVNRPDTYALNW